MDFWRNSRDVSRAQKRGLSEISAYLVAYNRFGYSHDAQLRCGLVQRVKRDDGVRLRSAALATAIAVVVAVLIALAITASAVPRALATPPGYSTRELVFNYSATGAAVNPIDWNSFITRDRQRLGVPRRLGWLGSGDMERQLHLSARYQ